MRENHDISLATLQSQIRAEAQQLPLPPAVTAPRNMAQETLPADHPQRLHYALDDFLHVHNEEFVELAYRCLLKRAPDAAGQLEALQRLAAGDSKIALLGDLRHSVEGRGYGVQIRGLAPRYRFWRLTRLPLLGGMIERLALLWSLPEIAREQRQLGQALAREHAGSEVADLAAEVARLREEIAALHAATRQDDVPR
jgi:hypothetical protein